MNQHFAVAASRKVGQINARLCTRIRTRRCGTDPVRRFETFPWILPDRNHGRAVAKGGGWGGVRDVGGYSSEQILSTTHFRLYRSLGGDAVTVNQRKLASRQTLYLIFRAIGSLASNPVTPTPKPDIVANALQNADIGTIDFEGYRGGAFHKVIRWSFEKQGRISPRVHPARLELPVHHPRSTCTSTTAAVASTHSSRATGNAPTSGTGWRPAPMGVLRLIRHPSWGERTSPTCASTTAVPSRPTTSSCAAIRQPGRRSDLARRLAADGHCRSRCGRRYRTERQRCGRSLPLAPAHGRARMHAHGSHSGRRFQQHRPSDVPSVRNWTHGAVASRAVRQQPRSARRHARPGRRRRARTALGIRAASFRGPQSIRRRKTDGREGRVATLPRRLRMGDHRRPQRHRGDVGLPGEACA